MKKTILILVGIGAVILFTTVSRIGAQVQPPTVKPVQLWEYAMLKWDGPDRMQYILPDRFDQVRMEEQGFKLPKEAQEEQYYLTMAANKLAKDGWEAIGLDSRRLLLRRSVLGRP